jgi:hypothetical protein
MTSTQNQFNDLYKGVVVSSFDPLRRNRIMVRVDDVLGSDPCIWATSHSALAGMHIVPAVQSGVWIKLEDGDVNRAVWTGFWRGGTMEQPPIADTIPPEVPQVVLGTPLQNYLLITDLGGPTGGIQLQIRGPAGPYIKLSEAGIEISCGPGLATIRLAGPVVDINNGALNIT